MQVFHPSIPVHRTALLDPTADPSEGPSKDPSIIPLDAIELTEGAKPNFLTSSPTEGSSN